MDQSNLTNAKTLIAAEGVTCCFGKHRAVSDISFTIQCGEILGILGPNGAGKSVTMQIICGVLSANSGKVIIAGKTAYWLPAGTATTLSGSNRRRVPVLLCLSKGN